EERLELAVLVHLADDVTATDELAADVELRDGRPARILFDALADLGIGEDVHRFERGAAPLEDLDDRGREATLGEVLGPLHEEEDGVSVDERRDPFARFGVHFELPLDSHASGVNVFSASA